MPPHIQVLGAMSVEVGSRPVALGAPRQRAVLALLVAARGTVVSVDRMVEELWRGEPPAKATVSLHAYVSNLRRLLEPGRPPRTPGTVLVTCPPGYVLRIPGDAVDAWRFEARVGRARRAPAAQAREILAEALGWWRGAAFQEYVDEAWAAPEAARLNALLSEARELVVAADLQTGHAAEAAAAAEDLVRASPLREEGWRLLAQAHWTCGRQADALASLRRARTILREELGCDPGPALVVLEQAILDQRLELLQLPEQEVVRLGSGELFVGRAHELEAVEGAARSARRSGGLVLVTGDAGAGKSALLGQVAGRLRAGGWTVVIGRCPEVEGAPPAWAWVEALSALARLVPPQHSGDMAALLHEPEGMAAASHDEATAARFRLRRAFVAWMRAAASGRPVAILIEDLHRADGHTLELLEAAAAVTGVPLLTVASYRTTDVGEPLAKTFAHLASHAPHRVALGGLSPRDVATIVDAVCGAPVDAATATTIAERTGGNPFYVWESARLLASEGALVAVSEVPQGVRDVLRRRIARLPDGPRDALRLAAVAGLESEISLLLDAADDGSLIEGLEEALAAGLLTEPSPGRVRFAHALVRDTVYTDLSAIRRSLMHDRIARRLLCHRPDDFAALAHHFARSGSTANVHLAVDYAIRAADLAERRYAHDVAIGLIEQALEAYAAATADPEADPDGMVALLVRKLGAQIRAGATDAARRTMRQAVDLAVRACRDDLVATIYGAWTEPSPWRSRLDGLYDRTALARLERLSQDSGLDGPTRARVLQVLVDAVAPEDTARAARAAETQLALARTHGEPRLLASALMTSAKLLPHEAHTAARPPLVAELRRLAHTHDLPAHRWVCEHLDALTAAARNDPQAVRRHLAQGQDIAQRYRMVWAQGINAATAAMLAAIGGRFPEAEAGYAEAQELFHRAGVHRPTGPGTLGVWTIRFTEHRERDIETAIADLHSTVGAPVAVAHALVLARLGRLEEARAVSFPTRPVTDHIYGVELDYRSALAVLLHDTAAATALIDLILPIQDQFAGAANGAYATRPLAHALGDLYRLLGDQNSAKDAYTLAEHVAHAWEAPHHIAAARRALAPQPSLTTSPQLR